MIYMYIFLTNVDLTEQAARITIILSVNHSIAFSRAPFLNFVHKKKTKI